jgi:hypothetical protein
MNKNESWRLEQAQILFNLFFSPSQSKTRLEKKTELEENKQKIPFLFGRDLGSISPTFYVQLLRQQSCASKVQT